jgi:hypothetical protein
MEKIRTWNDLKKELCNLIMQVECIYNRSISNEAEKEAINEYCRDIVREYKFGLEPAILCFRQLIQQAKDCGWIRYDYNASERFMETDRRQALPK